ncbi:MAG: tetratricopeptide repeat protein [Geobacteraceae bacterium]|nr:tetratricopeptide repeat protein [Geobacteraceae bacterium]
MSKAFPARKTTGKEPADTATAQPVSAAPKPLLASPPFHLLILVLVAIVAYSNTFHVPFVFDDESSIVNNPVIKDLPAFLSGAGYAFLPRRVVGYLSFALNYRLGGLDVTGYHAVNLAIHVCNAWLVYALVRLTLQTPFFEGGNEERGTRNEDIPFLGPRTSDLVPLFAALLFVAHPVQTQAVTYIVQRLASLATMFYLLALVLYVKGRLGFPVSNSNQKQETRYQKPLTPFLFLALSFVCALLAMRTKEIAATLPLVVVLYEFSFFGASARKKLVFLIPALLTLLIIPAGMIHEGKPLGELLSDVSEMASESRVISRGDYLLTQFSVIVTYIRLLIFPVNQNLDYDYPIYDSLFTPRVFLSFIFLLALLGLAVWLYYLSGSRKRGSENLDSTSRLDPRTSRLISFGILWFFITLAVESSVIPISDVIFEHRLYLPSVGAFIVLTAGAALLFRRYPPLTLGLAAAIVVIALTVTTWQRNRAWGDVLTFWMDNVEKAPNKNRPHHNLGKALMERGRPAEAIREFETAVRLKPDDPYSCYNLGTAFDKMGLADQAIKQFQTAISLKEDYADAHDNLGVAYGKKGWLDQAIEEFRIALQINPAYAETHYNLGLAYRSMGMLDKAVTEYQAALRLEPGNADVHNNLGAAYWQMGLADRAIEEMETAVRLKPDDQGYRANLNTMRRITETRQ